MPNCPVYQGKIVVGVQGQPTDLYPYGHGYVDSIHPTTHVKARVLNPTLMTSGADLELISNFVIVGNTLYIFKNFNGDIYLTIWNGTTATNELITAAAAAVSGNAGQGLYYDGKLFVFGAGTATPIKYRNPDGTWTALTMPGTLSAIDVQYGVVFGASAYVTCYATLGGVHGPMILAVTGTTVTIAHTMLTPSVWGPTVLSALSIYPTGNKLLYPYWVDSGFTPGRYRDGAVGSFDGTTWVDVAINTAALRQFSYAKILGEYRTNLYLMIENEEFGYNTIRRYSSNLLGGTIVADISAVAGWPYYYSGIAI